MPARRTSTTTCPAPGTGASTSCTRADRRPVITNARISQGSHLRRASVRWSHPGPEGAPVTEPSTVERDGHVLLIGVNRPAKRNAFNLATIDALAGAYEMLGTDDELRAGVLFAHGDHFSAGLDL